MQGHNVINLESHPKVFVQRNKETNIPCLEAVPSIMFNLNDKFGAVDNQTVR